MFLDHFQQAQRALESGSLNAFPLEKWGKTNISENTKKSEK